MKEITITANEETTFIRLKFDVFFSMTDDRFGMNGYDKEYSGIKNEAKNRQKKMLRAFIDLEVPVEDVDGWFDEAIKENPDSERLKENLEEWMKVTKRKKILNRLSTKVLKLRYLISHEGAILGLDKDRNILFELYDDDAEFQPTINGKDITDKAISLHDRLLDADDWTGLNSYKKNELALEYDASDTKYFRIAENVSVLRNIIKKILPYMNDKDEYRVEISESIKMLAFNISDDVTAYVRFLTEDEK